MKIIAYIAAAILIFFGILFIWGTFGSGGQIAWIFIGLISVGIGFLIIYFISLRARQQAANSPANVTLKVDLPANVAMNSLKCKSCGGTLTKDNIQMMAGAPVVTCPYCNTVYQLNEEPKW